MVTLPSTPWISLDSILSILNRRHNCSTTSDHWNSFLVAIGFGSSFAVPAGASGWQLAIDSFDLNAFCIGFRGPWSSSLFVLQYGWSSSSQRACTRNSIARCSGHFWFSADSSESWRSLPTFLSFRPTGLSYSIQRHLPLAWGLCLPGLAFAVAFSCWWEPNSSYRADYLLI